MASVTELRGKLIKLGMEEKDANAIKGKKNLENMIYDLENKDEYLEAAESLLSLDDSEEEALYDKPTNCTDFKDKSAMITTKEEIESDLIEKNYIEAELVNYEGVSSSEEIMALFAEDELFKGEYPKADGLRRIANLVIGPIVDESSKTECIAWGDSFGIKCDFSVSFECRNSNFGTQGSIVKFSDSSDCIPDINCIDPMFSKYPTAMSATRAEARVFRKALRLKTVAAEEMDVEHDSYQKASLVNKDGQEFIKEHHVRVLNKASENKGIKIEDILSRVELGGKKVEELTQKEFESTMKYMNEI